MGEVSFHIRSPILGSEPQAIKCFKCKVIFAGLSFVHFVCLFADYTGSAQGLLPALYFCISPGGSSGAHAVLAMEFGPPACKACAQPVELPFGPCSYGSLKQSFIHMYLCMCLYLAMKSEVEIASKQAVRQQA